MTYSVRKLITNAYNLSGIVPQGLNTISGPQLSRGLDLFNEVLSDKWADARLIPYYKIIDEESVTGQETYFIENLIFVSSVTFSIGPVRYAMNYIDRVIYWGSPRVNNINSLAFNYTTERVKGGMNLSVYFKQSSDNYPFQIMGKFALETVSDVNVDLEQTYDLDYINYLKYSLAQYICESYGLTFLQEKKLKKYESNLTDMSVIDFTIQKVSTMDSSGSINYGDVNIGRGMRPA